MAKDSRWCLICNPKNRTLYWHKDPESGDIWCWCNKCEKGRSLYTYCNDAGVSLQEFLSMDFFFEEAKSNEVNAMEWSNHFVSLADPAGAPGLEYVKSRGLLPDGDMYYDIDRRGIVFPYYFNGHFCGAQTRFLKPWKDKEGGEHKIDTMPGTRLGLLFYGWDQDRFPTDVKYIVVTEGAFNAIAINQAFNLAYGGPAKNPWRAITYSGSGITKHQRDALKEMRENGIRIIAAPDRDEAGLKALEKFLKNEVTDYCALPLSESEDWNDALKRMGHQKFSEWFLTRIKKV